MSMLSKNQQKIVEWTTVIACTVVGMTLVGVAIVKFLQWVF